MTPNGHAHKLEMRKGNNSLEGFDGLTGTQPISPPSQSEHPPRAAAASRSLMQTVPIEKGTETVLRATARLDLNFESRSVIWIKLVGGARGVKLISWPNAVFVA